MPSHAIIGAIWASLGLGGMATMMGAHGSGMFLFGLGCCGAACAMWQLGWIS